MNAASIKVEMPGAFTPSIADARRHALMFASAWLADCYVYMRAGVVIYSRGPDGNAAPTFIEPGRPRVCAHADENGRRAHVVQPGEVCNKGKKS